MRERYTPGYKSGYIHSPNHRFSKCSTIRLFSVYNRGSQFFLLQSKNHHQFFVGSFMKTFHRFFKQPEPSILGFWIFFPQRTGTANSLIRKCLKNRDAQFFKNSKNRATLVWTLNEEDDGKANNDRRPPEVQTSIYLPTNFSHRPNRQWSWSPLNAKIMLKLEINIRNHLFVGSIFGPQFYTCGTSNMCINNFCMPLSCTQEKPNEWKW